APKPDAQAPPIKRPAATMPGTQPAPAAAELDKDTRHEIHFGKMTHDGQMQAPVVAPAAAPAPPPASPDEKRRIPCPKCTQRLKVPANLEAGKVVKCPKCGELVKVPPPDETPASSAPAPAATASAPAAP